MKTKKFIAIFALSLLSSNISTLGSCGINTEPTHNHLLNHFEYIEPTCMYDGNIEYYQCGNCNKFFSDPEAKNEIDPSTITLPRTDHLWGDWYYIQVPSCEKGGEGTRECQYCHIWEEKIFEPLGHDLVLHKGIDEDCINLGIIDYWECQGCGKIFSDSLGTEEITKLDTYKSPKDHNFSEWETVKEASCLEDGLLRRRCSCGEVQEKIVYAFGHKIVDGKCEHCGALETTNLSFELQFNGERYNCTGWAQPIAEQSQEPIDLIIPATYNGLPVEGVINGDNPFTGDTRIKSVTFPDGLTSISDKAFKDCTSITSLILPSSLLHLYTDTFGNCVNLKYIECKTTRMAGVPSTVSFNNCSSITTARVSSVFLDFIPKENLETLELFYTSSVPELDECEKLRRLIVPSNIDDIPSISFDKNTNLQVYEYGNAYYLGDKDNKYTILYKAKNKDITVASLHKDTTIIAPSAFKDCKNLITIISPLESNLLTIDTSAFENCTSLIRFDIPQTVKRIENNAFANCTSIKEIKLSSNVTTLNENVFLNCTSLETLEIPEVQTVQPNALKNIGTIKNLVMRMETYDYIEKAELKNLTITAGDVKSFYEIIDLDKLVLCSRVTSVFTCAFEAAYIDELILEDGVNHIEFAAFRDNHITSIYIPASVTDMAYNTFEICRNLTKIEVDPKNTAFVAENDVLYTKDKSYICTYPLGKTDTSFKIPYEVKEIPYYVFRFAKLKEIYIGEILDQSIINSILGNDDDPVNTINQINLIHGAKSVKHDTFNGNKHIEIVSIPNSVTLIEASAFANCPNLKEIIYDGNKDDWEAIEKDPTWNLNTTNYIITCNNGVITM